MKCLKCDGEDWRRFGTRKRGPQEDRVQRLRCRLCGRVQDEDAGSATQGLRKGNARSSSGDTVFEEFWRYVASTYPLTSFAETLNLGMKRFGLSISTVRRWYRGGRFYPGPGRPGLDLALVLQLMDSLRLWDIGIRRRRVLAKNLRGLGLRPEPLYHVAYNSQVEEGKLRALVLDAHSVAIDEDDDLRFMVPERLPALSRRDLLVRVHERRARIPLPVILLGCDFWHSSPPFERTGWYLLARQVLDLFPQAYGDLIDLRRIFYTFRDKRDGWVDLHELDEDDSFAMLDDMVAWVSESRLRELEHAVKSQFEADLQSADVPEPLVANSSRRETLVPKGLLYVDDDDDDEPPAEEKPVFVAPTFISVLGREVTCSVIRGDSVDGRSTTFLEEPFEGSQRTWRLDIQNSTLRGSNLKEPTEEASHYR